jgi:hypothetical protein
VFFKSKDQIY